MNRALWVSATGMEAQQQMTDTIANNMANVNTTAYKRSVVHFQDMLYQNMVSPGANTSDAERSVGIQFGNGVRTVSIAKQFTQGSMESTSSNLDLAIEGVGFFEVQLPDDTSAFTRDGSFHLDSAGAVVTSAGYPVVGFPNIGTNAEAIDISRDGTVTVTSNGTPANVGNIQLSRFTNNEGLSSIGQNLYAETEASGNPQTGTPGIAGMGQLSQYYLENSNVQIIKEMVDMIASQRAYELNSKSIKNADDMLRMITNLK